MFPPGDEEYHPTAVATTMFIDRVDRDVAATIVEQLETSDASMRAAQLRVLGGAMARVPADATAYAHRASPIMVNVAAFYEGPEDAAPPEVGGRGSAALDQGEAGAYVNFVGDEGAERVHAAYPAARGTGWRRSRRRYDPENLFRRNQNIRPAGSS